MCDTWHAMCQHAWLTMKAKNMGMGSSFHTAASSVRGSSKEKEEEGRKGEEKGRKGKEKWRKRKEEKRRRKGRKRGKRKRKRKECCAVSRPGRQRTRNCAIRGRFPPTLVILRLEAM